MHYLLNAFQKQIPSFFKNETTDLFDFVISEKFHEVVGVFAVADVFCNSKCSEIGGEGQNQHPLKKSISAPSHLETKYDNIVVRHRSLIYSSQRGKIQKDQTLNKKKTAHVWVTRGHSAIRQK